MLSRLRAVCSEILRIWLTSISVIVSTVIPLPELQYPDAAC